MVRAVGGAIGMGNTCKTMANSCQCMKKTLQDCKVISLQLVKINEKKRKKERKSCSLLFLPGAPFAAATFCAGLNWRCPLNFLSK